VGHGGLVPVHHHVLFTFLLHPCGGHGLSGRGGLRQGGSGHQRRGGQHDPVSRVHRDLLVCGRLPAEGGPAAQSVGGTGNLRPAVRKRPRPATVEKAGPRCSRPMIPTPCSTTRSSPPCVPTCCASRACSCAMPPPPR